MFASKQLLENDRGLGSKIFIISEVHFEMHEKRWGFRVRDLLQFHVRPRIPGKQ